MEQKPNRVTHQNPNNRLWHPSAGSPQQITNTTTTIKERSFDLSDILHMIRKHLILFLIIIIVCALGYGFGRSYLDPPKYASSATIFLTPSFNEKGDLDQTSVSTNRTLLNNAIALMTRENILSQVAETVGNMTPEEIRTTLQVEPVAGTELISITSETTDPQLSKTIVDATVSVFIATMQENLNLNNITIVDQPKLNFESVSTPLAVYIGQGAAVGALIDALLCAAWILFDKRLKSKEEAEKYLGIPVFAVLPDLDRK